MEFRALSAILLHFGFFLVALQFASAMPRPNFDVPSQVQASYDEELKSLVDSWVTSPPPTATIMPRTPFWKAFFQANAGYPEFELDQGSYESPEDGKDSETISALLLKSEPNSDDVIQRGEVEKRDSDKDLIESWLRLGRKQKVYIYRNKMAKNLYARLFGI